MLVVPMTTPQGKVIGALQLINCKRDPAAVFPTPADVLAHVIPYPPRFRDLAASLASQAAVALENSRLYQSIQTLFEGFVQASVTAIESRDPTTSGHSFRVADFTVALATAVDRDGGAFRDVRFSPDEMKEIRYASLLHDFGKVGVREEVLVKAKKLPVGQLDMIRQRGEIIRRGLELRHARRKMDWLLLHGREGFADRSAEWDAELAGVARRPRPASQGGRGGQRAHRDARRRLRLDPRPGRARLSGSSGRLADPDHAGRGPHPGHPAREPDAEEYEQIQSHVVHTYQFLRQIPWTKELRRVPEIARSHHEKLNGGGYPDGWRAPDIPVQTRMMTISDIFDALTSRDRPYKPAVPVERALDILGQERKAGALDGDLLQIFIAVRPWDRPDRA